MPGLAFLPTRYCGGVGMPQRVMTSSRPSGAHDRRHLVGIDARQGRHVAGAVDQAVEEPAHRLLGLPHRVKVAHRIAPVHAAAEGQVRRSIHRKLGAVSQDQLRKSATKAGLLDGTEVPGRGIREQRAGGMIGVVAAADLGVEPARVRRRFSKPRSGTKIWPRTGMPRRRSFSEAGYAGPWSSCESHDVRILFSNAFERRVRQPSKPLLLADLEAADTIAWRDASGTAAWDRLRLLRQRHDPNGIVACTSRRRDSVPPSRPRRRRPDGKQDTFTQTGRQNAQAISCRRGGPYVDSSIPCVSGVNRRGSISPSPSRPRPAGTALEIGWNVVADIRAKRPDERRANAPQTRGLSPSNWSPATWLAAKGWRWRALRRRARVCPTEAGSSQATCR